MAHHYLQALSIGGFFVGIFTGALTDSMTLVRHTCGYSSRDQVPRWLYYIVPALLGVLGVPFVFVAATTTKAAFGSGVERGVIVVVSLLLGISMIALPGLATRLQRGAVPLRRGR